MTIGVRQRGTAPGDLAAWVDRQAAEHGWQRLEPDDVERYGRKGLVLHRPTGDLYEPLVNADPAFPGDRARTAAYIAADPPRFLGRPAKGPRTLEQARAEAADRRQREEEEREREARRLRAQPRRTVTRAWLEEWPAPMTVREACQAIAAVQGDISDQDGELIVELPAKPTGTERVRRACRVLFAVQTHVLAELEPGLSAAELAERLPDAEPRAGGGAG